MHLGSGYYWSKPKVRGMCYFDEEKHSEETEVDESGILNLLPKF